MNQFDRLKEYNEKVAAEKAAGTWVPPVVRTAMEKNIDNTTKPKVAIAAFCAHCMGCTLERQEPGWKDSVRECTSTNCPLYNFRPYKQSEVIVTDATR